MTFDLRPSSPATADSPISGAGSGIGRAISVRLAAEGAAVAACDLDGAAAQDTVRLLGSPGNEDGEPRGKHAAFQADVSQGPAAKRLLEQVQVNRARRRTPPPARPFVVFGVSLPLPPIGLLFSPAICRCVLCGHHTR